MSQFREFLGNFFSLGWEMGRASVLSVTSHWTLALFSLVAAFGVWMAIQDVENPRVHGIAPASGGIEVKAVNVPDGYVVDELGTVKVEVEAREEILSQLQPGDFTATVDVSTVSTVSDGDARPVKVTTRRDDVRVLDVTPANVPVRLVKTASREVKVVVNRTGSPPNGYQVVGEPSVDPAFVTIQGRPELVQSVDRVEMDVTLSGVRDQTFTVKAPLVARTESGNSVDVKLSAVEATASFKIDQIVSTRTMIVNAQATGVPASGFKIGGISADPPTVVVTGPKQVIDSLGDFLNAEPVDVTGARQDVIKTVNIQRPENVSLADRPGGSVVVKVEIVAAQCGGASTDDCPADTIIVPPTFTDIPAGMQIDPGSYSVTVIASGPLPALRSLKRSDITATVSLLGGRAGVASYEVKLGGAPEGVKLQADPISVSLSPVLP